MRPEGEAKPGAPKFEGFVIDVLELLKKKLKFNYTIEASDGYGSCKEDSRTKKIKCDGMMKELVEGVSILICVCVYSTFTRCIRRVDISQNTTHFYARPKSGISSLVGFVDF